MMFRLSSLAVVGVLVATVAQAGQVRVIKRGDARLDSVSTVDIVVEGLGTESRQCGLTPLLLQQTAQTSLSKNGIHASVSEKASSWFHTVHIAVASAFVENRCVTSILVDLTAHVDAIPEFDRDAAPAEWGSLLVGELSLVRRSGLTISDPREHLVHLKTALGDHVDAIGERIKAAHRANR